MAQTIKIIIDDYILHDDYVEIVINGRWIKVDRFMFEQWVTKMDRWADNYWKVDRGLKIDDLQAFVAVRTLYIEQLFKGTYSTILDIVRETK